MDRTMTWCDSILLWAALIFSFACFGLASYGFLITSMIDIGAITSGFLILLLGRIWQQVYKRKS